MWRQRAFVSLSCVKSTTLLETDLAFLFLSLSLSRDAGDDDDSRRNRRVHDGALAIEASQTTVCTTVQQYVCVRYYAPFGVVFVRANEQVTENGRRCFRLSHDDAYQTLLYGVAAAGHAKAKSHASYRSCDLSAALLSSDAMLSRARCRSTRMGANDSGVRVTGLPVALRFLQQV